MCGTSCGLKMALTSKMLLLWSFVTLLALCRGQTLEMTTRVEEERPPNTFVGDVVIGARLEAIFPQNVVQSLRYRFLTQGNPNTDLFQINEMNGIIKTKSRIDREKLEKDVINLDVAITKPIQYFRIIKVRVIIQDVNDNRPRFPKDEFALEITESVTVNSTFQTYAATDPDIGNNSVMNHLYEIEDPTGTFGLEVTEAYDRSAVVKLKVLQQLDREREDFYRVKIIARDGGKPQRSGSVIINITVADVNDHIPEFENTTYSVSIKENIAKYTEILQVKATDPDAGANGEIVYGFSSRTPDSILKRFGINGTSGQLYVKGEIDYEKGSSYNFEVEATDKGDNTGPRPAHALVKVNVIDLNDNPPQIIINLLTTSPNAEILESEPVGTFVAHISVEDPDGGQNGRVTCSLNNGAFTLQRISDKMYKVVTAQTLDREAIPMYRISVWCQDKGIRPLISYRNFNVTVLDDNDHVPHFTRKSYEVNMNENNAIGRPLLTVNATDEDSGDNGKIEYQLHTDAGDYWKINKYTGRITANRKLDREKVAKIEFRVIAVDNGKPPLGSTAAVTVNVMDMNDVTPAFTHDHYRFNISENKPKGTLVGTVLARDNDTTLNSEITYSITSGSNLFSIGPQNGQIYTKAVLNREERTQYVFEVTAEDNGYPKLHNRTTITVNVMDENDNIPVFVYPNKYNNTVHISNLTPVGNIIATIKTIDKDSGDNARVSYAFHKGNEEGIFHIDPLTGEVSVAVSITDIEEEWFKMMVVVRDYGVPVRTSMTSLNLVVNRSSGYIGVGRQESAAVGLTQQNLIIVVALVGSTVVLVIILIIAIVCIRRKDEGGHAYNVRLESEKKQKLTPRNLIDPSKEHKEKIAHNKVHREPSFNSTVAKKEVSFSVDERNSADGNSQSSLSTFRESHNREYHRVPQSSPSTHHPLRSGNGDPRYMRVPMDRSAPGVVGSGGQLVGVDRPMGMNDLTPRAAHMQQMQRPYGPQVHRLIDMLKRNHEDSNSEASADASNADSGRGASEEEINLRNEEYNGDRGMYVKAMQQQQQQQQQQPPAPHKQPPPPPPPPSQRQAVDPQPLRMSQEELEHHQNLVNKQRSQGGSGYYKNIAAAGSSYSIVDNTQVSCGSHGSGGGERDEQTPSSPKMINSQLDSSMSSDRSSKDTLCSYLSTGSNHSPPTPIAGVHRPHSPTKSHHPQQQQHRGLPLEGYTNSASFTEEDEISDSSSNETADTVRPGEKYSMGDMDSILSKSTMSRADSEAGTTTSGSYVVDAEELCNEIDNLFFSEMIV